VSRCLLCGAGETAQLFDKDGYPIVRCRSCGLVQVGLELDRDQLEQIYGEAYFTDEVFHDYLSEREVRVASGAVAARALARLVPAGRLLDVGCAAGFFLEAASAHYDVTGVEISVFASEYARTELGLRVLTGDITEVELSETFDVVTLWNTLEHMADPRGALERIASLTRPGALLALSTGDVTGPLARRDLRNWNLMSPPYHLSFFSPRTLDRLLAGAGFRLRRIMYDGLIREGGTLARRRAQQLAAVLGVGNVMTAYAVRTASPLTTSRARRLVARYRPLRTVRP
jgi:SAM-dependent methyltransferase